MNPGMKMMLISNRQNETTRDRYVKDEYMPHSGGYGADRGRDTSESYNTHMGGYKHDTEMDFDWPEGKRYKNGRYAPARYEADNDVSMRYEPSMTYGNEHSKPKMQIGFAGGGESDVMPFSQIEAEKWMRSIENEDGTKGPHWSLDQTKQLMAQKGVSADPWSFWVVINSLYADHSKTLRKHGVGDKIDIYVDMAKDFLNDKDSIGGDQKVAAYYRHIVKHN